MHFLPTHHIGGTHGQTESAVNALFDDRIRRRMVRVEGARAFLFCGQVFHQTPPTNRPAFRVFFGSSCCFTAFINGSASLAVPQASNGGILLGRWNATSEPSWPCNSPRSACSAAHNAPRLPSHRSHPRP